MSSNDWRLMTDRQDIRDAVCLAARWDVPSESLLKLIKSGPEAALEGLVAAVEADQHRLWLLLGYVEQFSLEQLAAAKAPEAALIRKQHLLDEEKRVATGDEARQPAARRLGRQPRQRVEHEAPPALCELLHQDRSDGDVLILSNPQYFAGQVQTLSTEEADDLRARLNEWWPETPFRDTITRTARNSWSQLPEAAAWLWLAPALDKEVTPVQWAEIASCGVMFSDQSEWLSRHVSEEALAELAARCDSDDVEVWAHALQAIPNEVPRAVVAAVVRHLRSTESEGNDYLRYIAERLVSAVGSEPLYLLSEVSERYAGVMRPLLAGEGDLAAQKQLLAALKGQLSEGRRPSGENQRWMRAIDNPELLPELFACVEMLYGPSSALPESGSWYRTDVLSPVMEAIKSIGGQAAVAGYDDLLERRPDFQFLRLQREAIAQAALQLDGLEAAQAAAAELGLPYFDPPR
jgi:hypothetical protein